MVLPFTKAVRHQNPTDRCEASHEPFEDFLRPQRAGILLQDTVLVFNFVVIVVGVFCEKVSAEESKNWNRDSELFLSQLVRVAIDA